jgi:hypothetical protein
MLFKVLSNMKLEPHIVPCIGGTECTDLKDKTGETIFRIDMQGDVFYNGVILHDYADHFDVPAFEFRNMLKSYLKQELGYNVRNVL